jgi:cellulose synthase/poly-beta-1,6-N-acetylglucosamine synthase-like glycosyltransferase
MSIFTDIANFFKMLSLIGFSELPWGWKAFIIYGTIFVVFALINLIQTFIGIIAVLWRFREVPAEDIYSVLKSNSLPLITFVVPAFNERKDIVHTVKNMLSLSYRYKRLIVINDGSTDNTFELLFTNFNLRPIPPSCPGLLQTSEIKSYYTSDRFPELLVIDKVNGGKADALNAGLNACTSEIVVCADADTLVDDDALNRLIRPFLLHPDTVAAHASIGNVNGCTIADNRIVKVNFPKKLLLGFQVIDFMKGFLVERLGVSWTKGTLVIPGNFGMFKLSALMEIGGYDRTSIIEDTEIITRMHMYFLDHKRKYKITYIPDIVAWTEAPETIKTLARQRLRWYKGTTQNIWDYRKMWFNPKYRSIGLWVCPMTVFEKIAPLIELSGFVILGIAMFQSAVDPILVLSLAAVSWLFLTLLVMITLLIEFVAYETYKTWTDFGRMLKCVACYTGYHYLLMIWRVKGLYAPKPKKVGWTPIREGYDNIQNQ